VRDAARVLKGHVGQYVFIGFLARARPSASTGATLAAPSPRALPTAPAAYRRRHPGLVPHLAFRASGQAPCRPQPKARSGAVSEVNGVRADLTCSILPPDG
jgi:hypothetical protein